MNLYHKIIIDGENFYREYNGGNEQYDELLNEQELFELLLESVVEEEIEISHSKIQQALRRISYSDDRDLLNNYICYLERLANE
ncbi:hypothetical protein [Metabacillus litoralis]|uniref:hypothetical protein n=1 Tax=Metabacillus litoralis TaxID=152268 RepID=UPI0020409F74|nr:hypothetical protein [Metabacillus litoralis]MCM3411135.1 hypothetical protein [Metabacillus litoralis]